MLTWSYALIEPSPQPAMSNPPASPPIPVVDGAKLPDAGLAPSALAEARNDDVSHDTASDVTQLSVLVGILDEHCSWPKSQMYNVSEFPPATKLPLGCTYQMTMAMIESKKRWVMLAQRSLSTTEHARARKYAVGSKT